MSADERSPMDHAAAHERIEDLLLDPARLEALEASTAPEDMALREHLDGCPACRADLDGWRRVQRRVASSLRAPGDAEPLVEPIDLPPSLRARVLAAVRSGDRPIVPIDIDRPARRRPALATWLGLAASLVILAGASVVTLDQMGRRAAAEAEANALATLVVAVDRILEADHRVVGLHTADGRAAGSISWSRHDWAVLTSALTAPSDGQDYTCWLEDGARSVRVGTMYFAGGTAYWVASVDEWATWEIGPETRFVVSLEAADAAVRAGEVVLSADLGS